MLCKIRLALLLAYAFVLLNSQPNRQSRRRFSATHDDFQIKNGPAVGNNLPQEPHIDVVINNAKTDVKDVADSSAASTTKSTSSSDCPVNVCKASSSINYMRHALDSFWSHDLIQAYSCACLQYYKSKGDGFAQAVMYASYHSKHFSGGNDYKRVDLPSNDPPAISSWDVLGPFPVGKLELDADPVFSSIASFIEREGRSAKTFDIGQYLVAQSRNENFVSELMTDGILQWKTFQIKSSGFLETRFASSWNEIMQGTSSTAAYEFQGWAKTTSYVKMSGSHIISCSGVHTAYVRNDNITRILTGDIYRSGHLVGALDLRVGPIAILIPLRGAAQATFTCSVRPSVNPIEIINIMNVPDLVELEPENGGRIGHGVMLSNAFSILIFNTQSHPITLDLSIEPHRSVTESFIIKPAKLSPLSSFNGHLSTQFSRAVMAAYESGKITNANAGGSITIAPGQVIALPLQLSAIDSTSNNKDNKNDRSRGKSNGPKTSTLSVSRNTLFLPCHKNLQFHIVVTPSRGNQIRAPIDLQCRKQNESILISYVDHDGSISQAGVLLPLRASPERLFASSVSRKKRSRSDKSNPSDPLSSCTDLKTSSTSISRFLINEKSLNSSDFDPWKSQPRCSTRDGVKVLPESFPVILSLHGTGITPRNQADAYKTKPHKNYDYYFGVEGMWVVTPSRHGAHNWEAIGELSALRSVEALRDMLVPFRTLQHGLPQVDNQYGVIAGHSMGGHGAWVASVNNPDLAVCTSAAAGWIKKEEYGTANAFFHLDIGNSHIDAELKSVLERSMGEFHVDKMISNLQGMNVHIRVGGSDLTVHPWYSRRMFRLLREQGINCTYEEIHGKQHWWWDTVMDNDGGVLNDQVMKDFFRRCLESSSHHWLAQQHNPDPAGTASLGTSSNNQSSSPSATSGTTGASSMADRSRSFDTMDHESYITAEVTNEESKVKERFQGKTLAAAAKNIDAARANTMNAKCRSQNVTLTVFNPAMQRGLCGLKVLQQHHSLSRSTVSTRCTEVKAYKVQQVASAVNDVTAEALIAITVKTCKIRTRNVKRLLIGMDNDVDHALFGVDKLSVNGYWISPMKSHKVGSKPNQASSAVSEPSDNGLKWSIDESLVLGDSNEDTSNDLGVLKPAEAIEVCIADSLAEPGLCQSKQDILAEKTLINNGPIRLLYARPFYIVYGTPNDLRIRSAIRDLAVYLASSHVAAHLTYVKVLSDVEYRSENYFLEFPLSNVLLVGGPAHNKLMKRLCFEELMTYNGTNGRPITAGAGLAPLYCHSPVSFAPEGGHRDSSSSSAGRVPDDAAVALPFTVGNRLFSDPADAVMFSFPIVRSSPRTLARMSHNLPHISPALTSNSRPKKKTEQQPQNNVANRQNSEMSQRVKEPMMGGVTELYDDDFSEPLGRVSDQDDAAAVVETDLESDPLSSPPETFPFTFANAESIMGVCLHASTAQGYLNLGRLGWPVVPPMVRAPFANYLPDVTIIDNRIWSHGAGGIKLAGFWDSEWLFDEYLSYAD